VTAVRRAVDLYEHLARTFTGEDRGRTT
jgi:hypothetical protein